MERDKKRVIVSTIVASVFLLVLIIGATYAYFGVGNSASGTTNLTTATEKVGTVVITNPTDNLYLKLSAYEMQENKSGTSYYATSTNGTGESVYASEKENNVYANYSITGGEEDTIYNCTFKLNITKPTGIRSGDMTIELALENGATINGGNTLNTDLYSASSEYTVSLTQTGNGNGNLITGDIKLNNTSGNQSHIAGITLTTSISVSDIECEVVEKVEEPDNNEESICTYNETSTVAEGLEGAKYNCKVDPNKDEYTFYLLDNNEDGTSDLIMNANINASGEAVIPGETSDTGLVAWISEHSYNSVGGLDLSDNAGCKYGGFCVGNIYGPVTALEYLHSATKSWTNVKPLNYEYYDREVQGIDLDNPLDHNFGRIGYQSFISTNGIAVITAGDIDSTEVTIGTTDEPLRTRMPIYSRDSRTEMLDKSSAPYLYDNIVSSGGVQGYWSLSASTTYYYARAIDFYNVVLGEDMDFSTIETINYYGVRPVITVKL